MNFFEAVASGFRNYASFSGRASRSEYWYWTLFIFLAGLPVSLIDLFVLHEFTKSYGFEPLGAIFFLLTFCPSLAVSVRRYHDINKSGWWMLICLTIIGMIPAFYWLCKKGDNATNRFGNDPLEGTSTKQSALKILALITSAVVLWIIIIVAISIFNIPPLQKAILAGDDAQVQMLLAAGADVNEKYMMNDTTALMTAVEQSSAKTVQLLVDAGANTEAEDIDGTTALMMAESAGNREIVDILRRAQGRTRRDSRELAPQQPVEDPQKWAAQAVMSAMSFGFNDATKKVSENRQYFTQSGYKQFLEYLSDSGFLKSVVGNMQVSRPKLICVPALSKCMHDCGYEVSEMKASDFEVPVTITLHSGDHKAMLHQRIHVSVQDSQDPANHAGQGISSWYVAPLETPPACDAESRGWTEAFNAEWTKNALEKEGSLDEAYRQALEKQQAATRK